MTWSLFHLVAFIILASGIVSNREKANEWREIPELVEKHKKHEAWFWMASVFWVISFLGYVKSL